jgi:hypothetical protein
LTWEARGKRKEILKVGSGVGLVQWLVIGVIDIVDVDDGGVRVVLLIARWHSLCLFEPVRCIKGINVGVGVIRGGGGDGDDTVVGKRAPGRA